MNLNSCIYTGEVRHRRHTPQPHHFSYKLFMMMLDLDELPTLFDRHFWWSVERRNLASFFRKDHFGDPHQSLAESVRVFIKDSTGTDFVGSIRLLTHLRYFGYVMNPISLFYCFDEQETLQFIVAEVTNTPWNEQTCYLIDVRNQTSRIKVGAARKDLHVSPFMQMEYQYRFHLSVPARSPDSKLTVHLENWKQSTQERETSDFFDTRDVALSESTTPSGELESCQQTTTLNVEPQPTPDFDATLSLARLEMTRGNLNRVLSNFPLMTFKVFSGIYWQALRLWWKGMPFVPHPRKRSNGTTLPSASK